jgi:hypothetical protein
MNLAQAIDDNERWIVSFYRTSEITGALFFGRLARSMKPGAIQADMTKHFADESQHAWYWTKCLNDLNLDAIKLESSYQDQYLAAAGMPTNLMEVLAITQVFERRVIGQYGLHRQIEGIHPVVAATIDTIMNDEKWHIQWVGQALKEMETEYGKDHIDATIRRFHEADQMVYEKTLTEHGSRLEELLKLTKHRKW